MAVLPVTEVPLYIGSFVMSMPTLNVLGEPGVTAAQVPGLTVIQAALVVDSIHSVSFNELFDDVEAVVEKADRLTGLGSEGCSLTI